MEIAWHRNTDDIKVQRFHLNNKTTELIKRGIEFIAIEIVYRGFIISLAESNHWENAYKKAYRGAFHAGGKTLKM